MSKVSDWQNGVPPCDGVWEILVPEHNDRIYYSRFKYGKWDAGDTLSTKLSEQKHTPYSENNNPTNPRQWRGLIE